MFYYLQPQIILRENFQNSNSSFVYSSTIFVSRYDYVNNGTWHVYKPLLSSSVANYRLPRSEISLSFNKKRLERSQRNGRSQYKLAELPSCVKPSAKRYVTFSQSSLQPMKQKWWCNNEGKKQKQARATIHAHTRVHPFTCIFTSE